MEKTLNEQLSVGERFKFGENWKSFLDSIDDKRINEAQKSLSEMLGISDGTGKTFLDIGNGSGLFSLAARKKGFKVYSFDFDVKSVECVKVLKEKYYPNDLGWQISEGSVLDKSFLESLGKFDVVYSWGVLHHTGEMWQAFENVIPLVEKNGDLFIAIYNDEGFFSRFWFAVKKTYCSGTIGQMLMKAIFIPMFFLAYLISDIIFLRNPFKTYSDYKKNRGMSIVTDWIDWIGGYPFEVATPNRIFNFFRERGFILKQIKTTNRLGCNEFVFTKQNDNF